MFFWTFVCDGDRETRTSAKHSAVIKFNEYSSLLSESSLSSTDTKVEYNRTNNFSDYPRFSKKILSFSDYPRYQTF